MIGREPAGLDSATLAGRLHDLVGDERRVQVDFLLHLDEFDRRQAFLPLGFGSLWDYCLKALHLREGAAGRRIGAMRVLRRFPRLEAPLRDGRLCLSTVSLLGQVLAEGNLEELVARAAFLTKAEVEHLVASVRPRAAPRDGMRRLPEAVPAEAVPAAAAPLEAGPAAPALALPETLVNEASGAPAPPDGAGPTAGGNGASAPASAAAPSVVVPRPVPAHRAEIEAVAHDRWSLRVTVDAHLKDALETLKALLSHKVPGGELAEVLREAVRCGIEKHGKRRGAVAPARPAPARRSPRSADPQGRGLVTGFSSSARAAPAAVRREVWARDGGRCTFAAADGRRCESRWQLELDHVDPAARGGASTVDNLRLRCRNHNLMYAEEVYGHEHMARFRRNLRVESRTGESAIPGDSSG